MKEIEVKILLQNKDICSGCISFNESPPWIVVLNSEYFGEFKTEARSLFEAITEIRLELEKYEAYLLCNASRKDVIVSGMSRSMGGGRKAYKVELGKQALLKSLVDIFEEIEPSRVSSIDEQNEFKRKWICSLKNQ